MNKEKQIHEYIKKNFQPVEDKPGYVWFNKRNFEIISIETLAKVLEKENQMSSNIIIFVKSNADNVAVKKDSIIGFDKIGNEYRIFLNGGGYVDIRAGQYEYGQLIDAMEGEPNERQ